MPRRPWRAACAVGALLAALGCGGSADRPPDLLLVTVDTLRADRLDPAPGAATQMPRLLRLASGGSRFETVYAPMGTTCPSHASLFTGLHPLAHGVVRNGLALLPEETTLAEILARQGYQTAGFVSSFPVSRRFGFDQGFEHFDDRLPAEQASFDARRWSGVEVAGGFDRRGDRTVDALEAWLAQRSDERPLFVWLHLFDPHHPHIALSDPGAEPAAATDDKVARYRSGYDAEVRFADAQLARAIEIFRRHVDTPPLLVVTADHGEGLFDHGWPAHNRYLYEEELRVPLVFHWEGRIAAGRRIAEVAHLVDLLPTLVHLLGLHVAPGAAGSGVDLAPLLLGEPAAAAARKRTLWLQRPDYGDAAAPKPLGAPELVRDGPGFGLREGRWKFIETLRTGQRELFDLERDPREQQNLAPTDVERARGFSARLRRWADEESARARPRAARPRDPQETEALRALGYAE